MESVWEYYDNGKLSLWLDELNYEEESVEISYSLADGGVISWNHETNGEIVVIEQSPQHFLENLY